jgi:hypothetical protein
MCLFLVASLLIFSPLVLLVFAFEQNPQIPLFINSVYSSLSFTSAVFAARWLLDRRSLAGLGLFRGRKAVADLIAGFVIAGLMMTFIFLIEYSAGWISISKDSAAIIPSRNIFTGLALALIIFILVGWGEELLFRGYLLTNLNEGLNWFWGMILSSAFFSLIHAMNPYYSWQAMIGLFLSGIFFAYSTFWSKGLWLPIGLHIGWNFFENTIYGFAVSGYQSFSLIQINQSGSEFLTGSAFGPEAGLILLPALAFGFFLVFLYVRRQGQG